MSPSVSSSSRRLFFGEEWVEEGIVVHLRISTVPKQWLNCPRGRTAENKNAANSASNETTQRERERTLCQLRRRKTQGLLLRGAVQARVQKEQADSGGRVY